MQQGESAEYTQKSSDGSSTYMCCPVKTGGVGILRMDTLQLLLQALHLLLSNGGLTSCTHRCPVRHCHRTRVASISQVSLQDRAVHARVTKHTCSDVGGKQACRKRQKSPCEVHIANMIIS